MARCVTPARGPGPADRPARRAAHRRGTHRAVAGHLLPGLAGLPALPRRSRRARSPTSRWTASSSASGSAPGGNSARSPPRHGERRRAEAVLGQNRSVALSIALIGVKGGVGKTTTAVNLAALAAAGGLRTLVWDLDPQGAASYALGFTKLGEGRDPPAHPQAGRPPRRGVPHRDRRARPRSRPTSRCARSTSRSAERPRPRKKVGDALASVDESYDAIFIDCPPGITLANDSALRAARVYLSPIVPSPLAWRAFDQLADPRRGNAQGDREAHGLPLDGRPAQARASRTARAPARVSTRR